MNRVIKKYTPIQLRTFTHMESYPTRLDIKLTYGEIKGPHYSLEYPEETFDTEDEAIEYADKTDPYATWLILPVVTFNNF